MKKTITGLILLLISSAAFGLSNSDLNRVLDLSVTLQSLSTAATAGNPLPGEGKYVILSGAVSTIQVVRRDRANFSVEVEIVDGLWHGLASVNLFRCVVQLNGPDYFDYFPARPTPNDTQVISANSEIMVIGIVTGTRNLPDGTVEPILSGAYVRLL